MGEAPKRFRSVNPATEQLISEYAPEKDISSKLTLARDAFRQWSRESIENRVSRLQALRQQMLHHVDELAELATVEMGKPIGQARAEVEKCASLCDYYCEAGPAFLKPQQVTGNPATKSVVRFDPLGPILAVMPWNFPYWQVMRFAVPSLLAGNVGILKHASNVLGCALRIQQLFDAAGFPSGVFQSLNLHRDQLESVVSSDEIQAVTLTGSEAAGVAIAEQAGRALKKCVLELGGSDPFIVLPDADLTAAVKNAVTGRIQNNGQSCIAAKRFIIHKDCHDQFLDQFCEAMQALRVGDPLDETTELGPLAREDLIEPLQKQVDQTVKQGATLRTGGHRLKRPGWYFAPTVLSEVTPKMTGFQEELFGPVACVIRAESTEDAVQLANQSRYGLGASVWTSDISKAEEIAASIEAGSVFINQVTSSHPTLPFGGIKKSGYGRELSQFGIHEFVNIKTIWVQ